MWVGVYFSSVFEEERNNGSVEVVGNGWFVVVVLYDLSSERERE